MSADVNPDVAKMLTFVTSMSEAAAGLPLRELKFKRPDPLTILVQLNYERVINNLRVPGFLRMTVSRAALAC